MGLTVSPWEWRQWAPLRVGSTATLENPPLFQQVDTEALNAPDALRDDFLAFVEDNAAALDARAASARALPPPPSRAGRDPLRALQADPVLPP